MNELVIVGAGPAGMAGAVAAAEHGIDVLVIDEQAQGGGQIFRRPPASFGVKANYGPYRWAEQLIARFESHPRIRTMFRSTAYGVLRDRDASGMQLQIGVSGDGHGETVAAGRLLIATGAYDMPVAFPGWTLPGVMTVGAAQSLLKSQKVLAGRRIILAGSHPLLLIAAEQLMDAGAQIAEIAFARGLPSVSEAAKAIPAAPGHLAVFAEAARATAKLVARGVKISTRTIVTEALGKSSLRGAKLSRVDRNWRPVGTSRELDGDLLLLGYGFSPSTELARQAGCEMLWSSKLGGWVVRHDASFATSAESIYIAGEPTGVAGAEQSWAEGWHAGLNIAYSLGVRTQELTKALAASEIHLTKSARFSSVVQNMFEPNRHALAHLSAPKETIVCRCELVTSERIDEVLDLNPFLSSSSALKLECRSGMGPCQGRYCEGTVSARIAEARNSDIESSGYFTAHFPIKPVVLNAYQGLDDSQK